MAYTTIDDGSKYFQALHYTGNDTGRSLTNTGNSDLQPDLVWVKDRDATNDHKLTDSSRLGGGSGPTRTLESNTENAEYDDQGEGTDATTAFNSDGFTIGTNGNYNTDGNDYVAWQWKANGGTTSSFTESGNNPGGTYQANTTAGFSIITYTGTGSEGTVAHGLSSAPEVVFIKNRTDGRSWVVGHTVSGFTGQYTLNTTGAFSTNAGSFNDTAPTSTVVNVNTDQTTNESGDSMVMYCWHSVEGYSKFGRYTGNGNADGTYIHLGFKPAFFMAKSTGVEAWIVLDNARPGYIPTGNYIYWNLSNAEGGAGGEYVDFLSSGLKLRTTGASANGSANFIYMAFAEMPLKYSNAR